MKHHSQQPDVTNGTLNATSTTSYINDKSIEIIYVSSKEELTSDKYYSTKKTVKDTIDNPIQT